MVAYVRANPDVTDILFTGGDPLIMRTGCSSGTWTRCWCPTSSGSTSASAPRLPAYWPQRFTTDADADDLLRLFERVVAAGRHLAVMAHYSHPRELETDLAQEAVRRSDPPARRSAGQAPLIRHVNDSADVDRLIRAEVRPGAIPYYMFVERDTGARRYFEPRSSALRDLHGSGASGVRAGSHHPRAGDVGHARQGAGGRHRRHPR